MNHHWFWVGFSGTYIFAGESLIMRAAACSTSLGERSRWDFFFQIREKNIWRQSPHPATPYTLITSRFGSGHKSSYNLRVPTAVPQLWQAVERLPRVICMIGAGWCQSLRKTERDQLNVIGLAFFSHCD